MGPGNVSSAVPPGLTSALRSDGTLGGNALHGTVDNTAYNPRNDGGGVELCGVRRMDGGTFVQAANDDDKVPSSHGVQSNLDKGNESNAEQMLRGGEVRLGMSLFEVENGGGDAATPNIRTCEVTDESSPAVPPLLSDQWLQSKLLEIQRKSLVLAPWQTRSDAHIEPLFYSASCAERHGTQTSIMGKIMAYAWV